MKRSLLAIALMACASLAGYCYAAVLAPVVSIVQTGIAILKDWILKGVALVGGGSSDLNPVSIRLTQAKAYVLRLAKRERPELTGSWRMCPST